MRRFSEIVFNKAFKLKTLELPEYLEKITKRYINEQLIKHKNDINKMFIEKEKELLQTIDKKNQEEFWKFTKISFNGFAEGGGHSDSRPPVGGHRRARFSALFGLGLLGYSSLIGIGYTIKNEIKEDMNKQFELINKKFELIDKKFEKLENKINDIDKKLDIIISTKKK